MTRISTGYIVNQALENVQKHLTDSVKLQDQISSGRRINKPSDDPLGTTQSLRLRLDGVLNQRFLNNANDALSELQVTESALSQSVDRIQRAKELATQAANGTLSPEQLQSVKIEVDSIIQTLTQLANSDYNGKYLFGGFKTTSPPFGQSGDDVAYYGSVNTSPDKYERRVQISEQDTMAVNVNGEDVFGKVYTSAGTVTSGAGLFQTLRQLSFDLASGDPNQIRQHIDGLQTGLSTVLNAQTVVGLRTNQLENLKSRIEDNQVTQQDFISRIEDTNMAQAISQLTLQQNLYQSSLLTMSKILSTSIIDFIR